MYGEYANDSQGAPNLMYGEYANDSKGAPNYPFVCVFD